MFRNEKQSTSSIKEGHYPFVIDQSEYSTIQGMHIYDYISIELSKFAKKIENEEK